MMKYRIEIVEIVSKQRHRFIVDAVDANDAAAQAHQLRVNYPPSWLIAGQLGEENPEEFLANGGW